MTRRLLLAALAIAMQLGCGGDADAGGNLKLRGTRPQTEYSLAAVVSNIRAHADYGALFSDTSDPYAPAGLQLPTAPDASNCGGSLTPISVSSLANLASNIGNCRHITLQAGSYSGSSGVTAIAVGNATDLRITATGATVTPAANALCLSSSYLASRVEIIGLTCDGGYALEGRDIKLLNSSFDGRDDGDGTNHNGTINGHRIALERVYARLSNGGFFTGAATDAVFTASAAGTTLTVSSVSGGALAAGQYLVSTNPGSLGIATLTGNGSVVTVDTESAHNLTTGDYVHILNATNGGFLGLYARVTVTDSDTFTYENTTNATESSSPAVVAPMVPNGTYIVQQLSGSAGGAGTYEMSVSQHLYSGTLQGKSRSTNLICGNCNLEETTENGNHENPVRFNGVNFGLIVDSRLWSDTKFTWRVHPDYQLKAKSGTVGIIRVQSERVGAQATSGKGVYPTADNIIVDRWNLYNGNSGLGMPRLATFTIQDPSAAGPAGISGNGATATVNTVALGELGHGLSTSDAVTISGNSTGGFNASSQTITVTGPDKFTYSNATSGSGTGGQVATARTSVGFFYMKNSKSYFSASACTGAAGTGWLPSGSGSPHVSWTTVPDAATSLGNGNECLTFTSTPAWSYRTVMP